MFAWIVLGLYAVTALACVVASMWLERKRQQRMRILADELESLLSEEEKS